MSLRKKLFVVQSKWRADGAGSIAQEEMTNFAQGVQRVLEEDLAGANAKIIAKSIDIDVALTQMGYQIHSIYILETQKQMIMYYALFRN